MLIDLMRAGKASPRALVAAGGDPLVAGGTIFVNNGKVPVANARMLRHWAKHSEWIRGAINIRKSQVSSAEWDIVPFDQTKRVLARQQTAVKQLLQTPNPANDSFRTFIEPIVEDLITLDAGCIEKVRNLTDGLVELWPVDGATVKVNALWDGDPEENRYFWWPDHKERARWKNNDFIYMMANRRTDSPVGLPPIETLRLTIEAELNAHEYNRRQVENAAPDGIINLGEGFNEQKTIAFRNFFESEVAGRGALGFIGGSKDPGFIKFRDNNRDMQFLEWQVYLVRKIAVVMGLTPQDLGVTFDINRSTAETQIQISEDRGLRPLMSMIQEYITEEIVWDKAFGGPNNNLAFRFTALNLKESTAQAQVNKLALGGVPWKYINEARIGEGREPIPALEGKLIMATPQGAVDIADVPTVREIMESQAKPAPAPAAKELDIGELATRLISLLPKEQTPPAIARGAINVTNLLPDAEGAFHALLPAKTRRVSKSTEYQHDERGLIIGKIETETDAEDQDWKRTVLTKFIFDDEGNVTGKTEVVLAEEDGQADDP
jgi:phage portal protein BeeE